MTELDKGTIQQLSQKKEAILPQSLEDRKALVDREIAAKKTLRLNLIAAIILIFIGPYLAVRPGQTPLIEQVSYWEAVAYFTALFFIYEIITYTYHLHASLSATKTKFKRVLLSKVSRIQQRALKEGWYSIFLENETIKKVSVPKEQIHFEKGDLVLVEVSEIGKQFLAIRKVSDQELTLIS